MSASPAREYAREATTWTDLDWWLLEAHAVEGNPRLTHALAFFAPTAAWRQLARGVPKALGFLLVPLHIAALTLPVVAAILMVGWLVGRLPVAPVGVAGILAGVAAAWMLVEIIGDVGKPDRRLVNGARLIALLHLVPAATATAIAALAVGRGGAESAGGIVGLVGDVVVGVVLLLYYQPTDGDSALTQQLNRRRLGRAIAALDEHTQTRILADLHAAIDVLEQRELVSPEVARSARQLPVGALGQTMAPRDRQGL